ncbi:hypothetical protein [Mycolicibacterium moriokaense]|uniref:Uncharacterized protein n=1 Tax=Mycolicibacterium moriokaense TaxID=39691 RepID=A0A318HR91_9MYCO|nr:hypothetical protein [Mycolicibacterium moriokaense]PXX12946.1 hypothetical protein C8E89_10194 [Mycolicibacterium moriokaense]
MPDVVVVPDGGAALSGEPESAKCPIASRSLVMPDVINSGPVACAEGVPEVVPDVEVVPDENDVDELPDDEAELPDDEVEPAAPGAA